MARIAIHGREIIMSMQHHLPDQIVRADPWKVFCAACSQKMRIRTSAPAEQGRETRTYGCACGHSETIDMALPPHRAASAAVFLRDQRPSIKVMTAPLARPKPAATLSIIPTAKDRPDPPLPSVRDAMLAAVPNLRAFAISLSRNADRADDLVQETLLRALRNIDSFQPGTNMSAWLFTILRNLFRSEYRNRRREVEDTDGRYVDSLKSLPEQHGRVELEEFRAALAKLPSGQREALLLVGASGFNYAEAAAICETAVGTVKSRVHRARLRLLELLSIESADKFGPDHTTRAIMTAGVRG
jgi:RNA polymerase sigma-70 factor (ECF subfamily)